MSNLALHEDLRALPTELAAAAALLPLERQVAVVDAFREALEREIREEAEFRRLA